MIASNQAIHSGDVARHYDQLDRFYREIWGDHVHHGLWFTGRETGDEATRALVDAVIARMRPLQGMRVCDVGCGYGRAAGIISREWQAEVTGLTISEAQRRQAEKEKISADNPKFLVEDWLCNKRPTGSFDAVIAIESTEHMADKPLIFSEAFRVLKATGRLVVCAWLVSDSPKKWQVRQLIEPICREGRMPGMGTEAEYRTWIAAAGFSDGSFEDLSVRVARTWPVCAWRFLKASVLRPGYLRFLLDRRNDNRIFALTMLRIWLAYCKYRFHWHASIPAIRALAIYHVHPRIRYS